jgi:uncharacterized protein (DUF342 family)
MPADLPKDLPEGLSIDLLDGLPADSPSEVPVDGNFHLYVDNDHMAASLSIEPPLYGGAPVAEEQVRVEMTARGVVAGILDDVLRETVERGIGSYVCIAKGLEPTPGHPAVFTNLIEPALEQHAQAADDEDQDTYARIDYRDLGNLVLVTPGIPLMRRTPAVPSIPGFDVTGKVIELAPIEDQPFADHIAGAAISQNDPNLLVAVISGAPLVMEHGVSVVALVEVDAVNLDTGNIDFDGSLKVRGDIVAGMKVHVTGDVIVAGTIEAADVHAGGNITVNGGIVGMTDTVATDGQAQSRAARLVCEGSVKARFISHARIDAHKMVAAEREIRQSFIDAGDCVVVGPPGSQKGAIVGGRIRAMMSVQSGVLGSMSAVRTEVQVGLDPRTGAKAEILQQKRKELNEQKAKLEKLVLFLHANPQKDVNNVGQRARDTLKQTLAEMTALTAQEAELVKALVPRADAYVAVKKHIYSGVNARLGNKAREFREDYPGGKLRQGANGEISVS